MGLRQRIKGIAERGLIRVGVARRGRQRLGGHMLVLAYHNVVPDETPPFGDRANHLPLSHFVSQLDALQATHEVVPVTEALESRPAAATPRVAITFDDAYAGALRYGITELVRRGLPATVFVAPRYVGGHAFWWDALSKGAGEGLPPRLREAALGRLKGAEDAIRAWAEAEGVDLSSVPEVGRAASEDELRRAAASPGITLGSHTWSHPNLTRIDARTRAEELRKPMAWLRERFPSVLPWIAYPYGHFDDAVARSAAEAGYAGGLGISGGWMDRGPRDPLALPRLNIPPGLSESGFELQISGIRA